MQLSNGDLDVCVKYWWWWIEIVPNLYLWFLDESAIKSYYKTVLYGVHFPLCDEVIMQWDRLYPCFQLQIEIILVGICYSFSSKLYVYAENLIYLHIKYYQIQNDTLKVVSHEAWLKNQYSVYFSGLQQSRFLWGTENYYWKSSGISDNGRNTVSFQFSSSNF